jgi:hypothetical protein
VRQVKDQLRVERRKGGERDAANLRKEDLLSPALSSLGGGEGGRKVSVPG